LGILGAVTTHRPATISRPISFRRSIILGPGDPPDETIFSSYSNDLLRHLVDAWFGGSAERAAKSLGLDPRTVYRYLSGKRSVPRRLAMQLAAVLSDREQDVKRRAKARRPNWFFDAVGADRNHARMVLGPVRRFAFVGRCMRPVCRT